MNPTLVLIVLILMSRRFCGCLGFALLSYLLYLTFKKPEPPKYYHFDQQNRGPNVNVECGPGGQQEANDTVSI